jgi:DNA repair exonuclease SbcCD nuclease subunit
VPIIIHTSDVNLGAPLGWLGPRAAEQREELRRTLSKIVDLVIDQQADALVVAGDLFHSNNPSAATVRFVLRELSRLTCDSRAHVVLLPGANDSLGVESVYTSYRTEFGKLDRVTVLGLDGVTSAAMDNAALKIHDCTPRPLGSPARTTQSPDTGFTFNVAVMPLGTPRGAPGDELPVAGAELPDSGWSYFALGRLGSWHEVADSPAPAVYAGSPELVSVDAPEQGHVARVELRASGATVSKVRVGARSVVEARVEVTDASDAFSIAERVRHEARSNPNAVLRLVLTGLASAEAGIDDWDLIEELAGDYFFVCPPVRDYEVRVSDQDLAQLPEQLVVGRFARHMRERLEAAETQEERQEIEDALQLGVSLLQGKDVI